MEEEILVVSHLEFCNNLAIISESLRSEILKRSRAECQECGETREKGTTECFKDLPKLCFPVGSKLF